jgi:serpin B
MMENIVQANTAFTIDLFRKLADQGGNVFFSPYSIMNCLAMAYAGAKGNTEKEMAKVLHLSSKGPLLHQSFKDLYRRFKEIQSKKSLILKIANALWIQSDYKLKQDFTKLCRDYYISDLFYVNYEKDPKRCRLKVNKWIAKQTENKIRDILQPDSIDDLTRLIITNAIYFRGNWMKQFRTFNTKDDIFWQTPERKLKTKMMFQMEYFGYKETADLQVLEMPYVGKDLSLSMIILLPREQDGLSKLEEQLSVETLREWIYNPRVGEVKVFLPRFEITSRYGLNSVLSSLGIKEAFTDRADFSGMGEKMKHWISEIVHKTFIKVYEEGSEAGAATFVCGTLGILSERIPEFRADHPFLFIIRENRTECIIFIGRVWEPREKNIPY